MIGKVTIKTSNPPCECGGMAGFHLKGCKILVWTAGVKWARLHYAGENHRWHILDGLESICGHQRFDNDRAQYRDTPLSGKLCKLCIAKQKAKMDS